MPTQRVLVITSEWPTYREDISGIHVLHQVNKLRELGLIVDVLHFRGKKNPVRYIQAIMNLHRRELRKYDLIHAHHGQSGVVALAQSVLPVVITFHGSDLQGIRNHRGQITVSGYILRSISWFVAHRADAVIIVSEHMKQYLPQLSCYVIPAGIDLGLFRILPQDEARQSLGFSLDSRLVLFVGNPSRPEKRYRLAKEVMGILKQQINVDMVIANGVAHDRMPLYMNACDVLLITSSSEGSPNAVKEALACNLSIVSTNVGDIRKRNEDIQTCVVCEDDRALTIANALLEALTHPRRIDSRRAVHHLDERFLTRQLIDIYENIINH